MTANRTMVLDAVTDDLLLGQIMVARAEHEDQVLAPPQEPGGRQGEDDDGTEYYEYVKVGDDHFGYVLAYVSGSAGYS